MEENKQPQNFGALNLVVLVLSVYILMALLVDTFFKLPPETSKLLEYVDSLICVFFLIEIFVRLYRAPNKKEFWKWGWVDLVASIPTFNYTRFARILRLIRLLRLIRAFKTTQQFLQHIYRSRAEGAFSSVATIAFLLIIFCSVAILQVETDPASNIKTAGDAIWWSYATVTTVGYGDKYPVTTEGRLIGMVLMTAGVGLFGTFSGFIASWFVTGKKEGNIKE